MNGSKSEMQSRVPMVINEEFGGFPAKMATQFFSMCMSWPSDSPSTLGWLYNQSVANVMILQAVVVVVVVKRSAAVEN